MTDVSIVIVNWNTRDYLLRCLRSVSASRERGSWEVIVVDNGSEDGSAGEVKRLFPEVVLIENGRNLGFAKATNQGISAASGKYIVLLNPDTEAPEGSIGSLVAFMRDHPDAGIAGAQLLNEDGSRQNSIANFPSLATELLNKSLLRRLFPERYPGKEKDYSDPVEVESVIGACMMTKREALERVGGLDEDYFLFFEETDWCYRMRAAGWKVYHVPQAKVIHFQGKGADRKRREAKVEYYLSRYHFFMKNRGKRQWFFLLVGLMAKLKIEVLSMFVGCLLTLFLVRKWRRRLSVYAYLLVWHLRLCPKGWGLNNAH